jgi:hypothetical protein
MKKLYPLLSVLFLIYWGCEEEQPEDTTPQDTTPPEIVILSEVNFQNNSFTLSWTQSNEDDFYSYIIYQSNDSTMNQKVSIDTIFDISINTTLVEEINSEGYYYFEIGVKDESGNESYSNIERGSSYDRFFKTFGSYGGEDRGYSVIETSDNGYVMTGLYKSYGSWDLWVLKTDKSGNEVWDYKKDYYGNQTTNDVGRSIIQTNDGGFVVLGWSQEQIDLILLKLNVNGELEWEDSFPPIGMNEGYSLKQTQDGGFIIVGYTTMNWNYSDTGCGGGGRTLLVKSDGNGNLIWVRCFDTLGGNSNKGLSIDLTHDDGFVVTGGRDEIVDWGVVNQHEVVLLKVDNEGNEIWSYTYDYGVGHNVKRTNDNGFIVCGSLYTGIEQSNGNIDVLLLKTDSDGNEEWRRTFGGVQEDRGYSVKQTNDGGYIFTGFSHSNGNDDQSILLIKTDSNGYEEWSKTIKGNKGFSVVQTENGKFVLTGNYYNGSSYGIDLLLVKTDSEGNYE